MFLILQEGWDVGLSGHHYSRGGSLYHLRQAICLTALERQVLGFSPPPVYGWHRGPVSTPALLFLMEHHIPIFFRTSVSVSWLEGDLIEPTQFEGIFAVTTPSWASHFSEYHLCPLSLPISAAKYSFQWEKGNHLVTMKSDMIKVHFLYINTLFSIWLIGVI